jgi:D-alanyl-lipoteichoic acid acyltransferase DltB (MBOAT superfamily)
VSQGQSMAPPQLVSGHAVAVVEPTADAKLDARQWALLTLGLVVIATVLPPVHFALFLLNGLFGFWVARQPWDWIRRFGCFFLIETIYFYAKVTLPRPFPAENAVFARIFPAGEYFLFLWFALELILYLKLMDFVLSGTQTRRASFAEFCLYVCYPFTLLNGPVIAFEEQRRGYQTSLFASDLVHGVRKCLWGGLQLFVLATWLHGAVHALRAAVMERAPVTEVIDARLLMWVWLAGMSVLMHLVLKGYTDLMTGLSRLVGYRIPEQFWFGLFARDPAQYWQHSNRWVYRITSQHIFTPFFDRRRIFPKVMMATMASGAFHTLVFPRPTMASGALLTALLGLTGVAVVITYHLRWIGETRFVQWLDEGPGHNALVVTGVVATFALMAFPRSTFLLMVEGVSVPEWFQLMRRLFVVT